MSAKNIQVELSEEQIKSLIAEIKSDFVSFLITKKHDKFTDGIEFDYYQSSQIAGILNINAKTLSCLPIPKYPLHGGKIIFYRLSEVHAYFQTVREK